MVDVCDLVDGWLVPSHTDDLREAATEHETTPAALFCIYVHGHTWAYMGMYTWTCAQQHARPTALPVPVHTRAENGRQEAILRDAAPWWQARRAQAERFAVGLPHAPGRHALAEPRSSGRRNWEAT